MRKIIIVCLFISLNYLVKAQIPTSDLKKLTNDLERANFSPFAKGGFSNLISNFSLSSILGQENAKIELKNKSDNSFWVYGLTVDQNLSKNAKKATFFDFDKGVSPGTTISFNVQRIIWQNVYSKQDDKYFLTIVEEYAKEHGKSTIDVSYKDILKDGTKEQKAKLKKVALKQPYFVNGKIAFTKTKFSFAEDSVVLKKIEVTHFNPDISFSIGRFFSTRSYLALTYNYSESFEGADEVSFSRPFGTTNNFFSETLAFGSPTYKNDHKVTAEFRQSFGDVPVFAIAPAVTYGFASEKIGISLPIYFIKGISKDEKPNGIQGGVSFGYVTSVENRWAKFKDGFGAQLIVTAPFSVFDGIF